MGHKLITVFTPSYNRGYCLSALYQSLKRQTSSNFSWFIINDGSTDNTEDIVKSFLEEQLIDIKYEYEQNSGKHVAHNKAVKECNTELFYCVDSDDELPCDAIESIEKTWHESSENNKKTISGMVGYKAYRSGGLVGTEFPKDLLKSSLKNLYAKGKTGDTALIYRTNILKQYPFKVFQNERFLRESTAYDLIDDCYELLIIRKNLYLCEYLKDGLSRNTTRLEFKYPKGAAFFRLQEAKKAITKKNRLRNYAAYVFYSIKAKQNKEAIQELGRIKFLLLLPFAFAGLLRYKLILNKKDL